MAHPIFLLQCSLTRRALPSDVNAIDLELVLLLADITPTLKDNPTFMAKCTTATDGSRFCELVENDAAIKILVRVLFEDKRQFSDALKEALEKLRTREKRREFFVGSLVRYAHMQAKDASDFQDSDECSSVYMQMAGTVKEIVVKVHGPVCHCIIALGPGQRPPVLFLRKRSLSPILKDYERTRLISLVYRTRTLKHSTKVTYATIW
jgi:hypothetical protein